MKTTVDVKELKTALDLVKSCVPTRTSLPILRGVRLEVSENGLVVSGTDLDALASFWIPCETDLIGTAIVPLREFQNIVKISKGQMALELDGERLSATNGARSTMPVLPAEEWPRPHTVTSIEAVWPVVDLDLLANLVVAASDNDDRPTLSGVCFTGTQVVATDSYRLHFAELSLSVTEPAIIPAVYIKAILRAQKKLKQPVGMTIGASEFNRYAVFACGTATWRVNLIPGQFPNWHQVIPETYRGSAIFDRAVILPALDQLIAAAGNDSYRAVKIEFATGRLTRGHMDSATVECFAPCATQGQLPEALGVNPAYLRAAIAAGSGESVTLAVVEEDKPFMVKDESEIQRLLMAIRL